MAKHAHGPSPKGLLCNVGAGAAAGKVSATTLFFIYGLRLPKVACAWY